PWCFVCDLQPARRTAWRRQSRIGELPDADAAAPAWIGKHFVPPDVFGRVLDLATSGISGIISDWRNLSRPATGRSPAPAQCLRRIGHALHRAVDRESFLAVLWRSGGRARAR